MLSIFGVTLVGFLLCFYVFSFGLAFVFCWGVGGGLLLLSLAVCVFILPLVECLWSFRAKDPYLHPGRAAWG